MPFFNDTPHTIAEITRRLDNLLRIGVVEKINHSTARCRVKTGGLITDWLPWLTLRAGTTRTWYPPTIGEQVVLLSLSGELNTGVVLLSLYSDTYSAPSHNPDETITHYPDGARCCYNHVSGALTASGVQSATVQAAKKVIVDCPETIATGNVTINGALTVQGLLTYQAGMMGASSSGNHAATKIYGAIIQQGGPLSSNGVVLDLHTHEGVQAGNAHTGLPK